ncbi:peptide-binding protein [Bacteroides faecis]|nr:peptide-binding protein [Bacteroides faecis]KAA5294532.1 peptide-binding protein [Bacteroides faecis]KAA5303536.1 peptide-binding protein [Bacteroides faecis]
MVTSVTGQQTYFISSCGNDSADGSLDSPLLHIHEAIERGENSDDQEIHVYIREGKYYLGTSLVIDADKWKNKRLTLSAYNNEPVVLSGARKLSLNWVKQKNGIWKSKTEAGKGDQLFVDGEKRILARYPDFEEGAIFNGTAADAIAPARVKRWKSPEGGFIHALHARDWGDMHYVITGKDDKGVLFEGGYQNNRPSNMHDKYRFVENIYEELDAPGEWFLDGKAGYLYYYPYSDENIDDEVFEIAEIPSLIKIKGAENEWISDVTIRGICFSQTSRTFMADYEPLLRSDWAIYRGAAVFIENAERCRIEDCEFTGLGGNAIFLSRHIDDCVVKGNYIHQIGASAVCIVGDTSTVRSGVFKYEHSVPYELMDKVPGPKNEFYPRQCLVEDNLIHDIGLIEKQVAGVQIQVARGINVRHNTIYRVPRAAINIGDGSFGGHVIEYNDAFATVLETSDHGAFNSWGRDRFWHPSYEKMSSMVAEHPELILLDALFTTYIRYNRFRCDHGWDIDLDDGSSNFHIYGNVCLHGGIKLREGFNRVVENNILINNTLHPHLWFQNCGDIVRRNVFTQAYLPIELKSWGKMVDYNFFSSENALKQVQKDGTDAHSTSGTLLFADYQHYNFALSNTSKAFEIGFENIPQNVFGVYSPRLKRKAEKPELSELLVSDSANTNQTYLWEKTEIRLVNGLGDRSAYGLPDEKGCIILKMNNAVNIQDAGLKENDVIYSIYGEVIDSVETLVRLINKYKWRKVLLLECFRNQQKLKVSLVLD